MVSDRVSRINKSAIHEMTRLSRDIDDVAFLSWAKPTSDTPEHIKEGAISAIRDGLAGGYSPSSGLPELREEIVKKLKNYNNINANPSQIIVTVGAIEGLAAAVMAVIDPGDEVIFPSPTYSTHIQEVVLASGKPVIVPLVEENGFAWDIDAVRDAITPRTRAIMYASPSNPTGTVFSEKQLRQLADIALENNLMVITDEAYEYFVYDDNEHFCMGSIPEMKKNVISTFTFTKNYAMTGWRIGYLASSKYLVNQLAKMQYYNIACPPTPIQKAVYAAVLNAETQVQERVQLLKKRRDIIIKRVNDIEGFNSLVPKGAFYAFPAFDHDISSEEFAMKLLRSGVICAPGSAFGKGGEGHLRFSFANSIENIERGMDIVERVAAEIPRKI